MSAALTRRRLLNGAGALIGIGVAAGLADQLGLFAHRWPPSPYDDLLGRLPLRAQAVVLGQAVLAAQPQFAASAAAARLRHQAAHQTLADIAQRDAASNQLIAAQGWILPAAVGELAALAALAAAQIPAARS